MNAATQYLQARGETLDLWHCGGLADAIRQDGDDLLYVEGPGVMQSRHGWIYHMVIVRDGYVHDAWCEGEPLPVREWLIEMFGPNAVVEVSLNGGDAVYTGTAGDYHR